MKGRTTDVTSREGRANAQPQVSVVIPAYNVETCLARTVDAVLAQDFQDFEILIIDDGSADGTLVLANGLACRDERIRVCALPSNQGPSAARNRGLAEARGQWIAILDADDIFLPSRLGHLLELAARRGADAVADDLLQYDLGADQQLPCVFGWTEEHMLTLDALLANAASMSNRPLGWIQPVWRRDFLRRHGLAYPLQYRYAEDFFLLASTLLCGARIWLSPRAEYVYTLRHGPISGQASQVSSTRVNLEDVTRSCQELLDRYSSLLLSHQVRALKVIPRSFALRKRMADAIRMRRQQGMVRAALMLLGHPAAAWGLAIEKAGNGWRRIAG